MRRVHERRHLSRRAAALLGGLVLLAGIAGSVAWAAIPGDDDVIHGCYLKAGGFLRVIDPSVTKCKKIETAIWWNQSGAPGEPGEPGSPGEQGPPGPGAAFAELNDIVGPGVQVQIPNTDTPVEVLTIDLPDDWDAFAESVVIATLQFENNGDQTGHVGCTLISDNGGYIGMHWTLAGTESAPGDPYRVVSFQGAGGGGNTEVVLSCNSAEEWGPPVSDETETTPPEILVTQATLTAIPMGN